MFIQRHFCFLAKREKQLKYEIILVNISPSAYLLNLTYFDLMKNNNLTCGPNEIIFELIGLLLLFPFFFLSPLFFGIFFCEVVK